jgi:hypothetical protein
MGAKARAEKGMSKERQERRREKKRKGPTCRTSTPVTPVGTEPGTEADSDTELGALKRNATNALTLFARHIKGNEEVLRPTQPNPAEWEMEYKEEALPEEAPQPDDEELALYAELGPAAGDDTDNEGGLPRASGDTDEEGSVLHVVVMTWPPPPGTKIPQPEDVRALAKCHPHLFK